MSPILFDYNFSSHENYFSILNSHHYEYPPGGLTAAFWKNRILSWFNDYFVGFTDRWDMGLTYEAFFSIHSAPVVIAGLVWVLVKRDRRTVFLVGCCVAGALPHMLSYASHTGRLIGVVPPLFLLGAVATEALARRLESFRRGMTWVVTTLGVLWALWSFQGMYYRCYTGLFKNSGNIPVTYQVFKRNLPKYRVYFKPSPLLTTPSFFNPLVDDTGDLFLFKPGGNEVPRFSDGHTPDVVVCFHESEVELLRILRDEFPKGRAVKNIPAPPMGPREPGLIVQFYIRGADLTEDTKALFRAVQIPEGTWRRRYFAFPLGLCHGILSDEDWTADPLSPTRGTFNTQTMEIKGTLKCETEGQYHFVAEGRNYAVLDIDGVRVLDYRPFKTFNQDNQDSQRYIRLKAGNHRVTLRTVFKEGYFVPKVWISGPDRSAPRFLGAE